MLLQLSTWPEVDAYLKKSTAVIIPIGSTEQHGPNGFIGTDALCPEVLAKGVSQQIGALKRKVGHWKTVNSFPGVVEAIFGTSIQDQGTDSLYGKYSPNGKRRILSYR